MATCLCLREPLAGDGVVFGVKLDGGPGNTEHLAGEKTGADATPRKMCLDGMLTSPLVLEKELFLEGLAQSHVLFCGTAGGAAETQKVDDPT